MRSILTKEGFDVVGEAADGDEAIALCRAHEPDLMTLDVNLEGKGGIETLKEVKLITTKTRVVMVTSSDDSAIAMEALSLGADNFIGKPYTPETVLKVVSCISF